MGAPRGFGLYLRDDSLYPGSDPAGYAKGLGASWVALLDRDATAGRIARAVELFGTRDVMLWDHPDRWDPDSWPGTLASMSERVRAHGLRGFIADPENRWGSRDASGLGAELARVARRMTVGVTSFPAFGGRESLARAAGSRVFLSPQLYGVGASSSLRDPAQRAAWLATWNALGAGPVIPSIRIDGRSPSELTAYLQSFVSPSVIAYQGRIAREGTLEHAAIRAYALAMKGRGSLVVAGLIAAGAVAAVVIGKALS